MSPNELSSQTSSIKTRFASRFLQSLLIMKKNGSIPSSLDNIHRRSRRIKIASYSSMALAVGSKRAWSRALIFKIRTRVRHQGLVMRRRRSSQLSVVKKKKPSTEPISKFDKLRELVPGGEKMDLCNLLEETAHYIKCLDTQVKVMEKMADALST